MRQTPSVRLRKPGSSRCWLAVYLMLASIALPPGAVAAQSPAQLSPAATDPTVSAGPAAGRLADHVPGRLLVKFRPDTDRYRSESIHVGIGATRMRSFPLDRSLELVRLPDNVDLRLAMEAYRAHSDVLYVEPDYILKLQVDPDDPRYGDQWGLHNVGQPSGDPTDQVCLGGANSGLPCLIDAECRGRCSDDDTPCDFDTDCSGNCSLDDTPCLLDQDCQDYCSNNNAPCLLHDDCGGNCSLDSAPCTQNWQCQRYCDNNSAPCNNDGDCGQRFCSNNGAPCNFDWDCDRFCQGGVNNGMLCSSNFDCDDRQCFGGYDVGQLCSSDSQCRGQCVGGSDHGDLCSSGFDCRSACSGGPDIGQSCSSDFECRNVCVGGSNPGTPCSSNFQCLSGGSCQINTCNTGSCQQGTCSDPGVCGPSPTCESTGNCRDVICQLGTCVPSVCQNPTCIAGSCGSQYGLEDFDIDAPEAWGIVSESPDVIIASIDTGVDFSHEDMSPAWVNPGEIPDNGIDDDGNGYVDDIHGWDFVNDDNDPADDHWHGTFTMGIAAARGNNGVGVSGVTWNARIMALKSFDQDGVAASTSATVAAIDYATANGADVTNNSYTTPAYSQALEDAVRRAESAGIVFVAAAGNDGLDIDLFPAYPASFDSPNIISVAAMNRFGLMSNFSNFGATTVDLGAPGERILSTTPYSHLYGYESGTSMAVPYVVGAVALMYQLNPRLGYLEVKQIVLDTVVPADALRDRSVTGGMLNLNDALLLTPLCQPLTCAEVGAECGTIDDGCGGTVQCTSCDNGLFCDGLETCAGNTCQPGTSPCAPGDYCDEDDDVCLPCDGAVNISPAADFGPVDGAETGLANAILAYDDDPSTSAAAQIGGRDALHLAHEFTFAPGFAVGKVEADLGVILSRRNYADVAVFYSLDDGGTWTEFGRMTPTVFGLDRSVFSSDHLGMVDLSRFRVKVTGDAQQRPRGGEYSGEVLVYEVYFVADPPPYCPCATDADCDDGNFCNGPEICQDTQCRPPTIPACGPGEICHEDTDTCEVVPSCPPSHDCGGNNCQLEYPKDCSSHDTSMTSCFGNDTLFECPAGQSIWIDNCACETIIPGTICLNQNQSWACR